MEKFESELNDQRESAAAYTRFESSPSVGQLSGTHEEKQTIIKSTLIATIGSFVFTYGILASNGNNMAILVIFFLTILMTEKLTVFNPAVSLIELLAAKIGFQEFIFNVAGQVGGSLLGALVCFFVLGDFTNAPYEDAKIGDNLIGVNYYIMQSIEGELFGSILFMIILVLQEDDYLKWSDEKLEHGLVVTLGFGAARVLTAEGKSLFNPAFAFRYYIFQRLVLSSLNAFKMDLGEDLGFCGFSQLLHFQLQSWLQCLAAKFTRNFMTRKYNTDFDLLIMNQIFTNEQQLLIEEVINKGYNQDDFESFVLLKEPQKGHDLNQWTYDELFNIIKQFQQEKLESPLNQNSATEPDSPDFFEQVQLNDKEIYPQKSQEAIKLNEKMHLFPYEKTIHCKHMHFFIDENIELQFEISPPVEERGGILDFFSKTIVFPIQVNPMQWKVKRTLQDFIQLRNILCAAFPEYIIPSFPYSDIDDYDIIMKEQQSIVKVLTVFLQIYNKKTIIRTTPASFVFLNENNQKQFLTKFYKEQPLTKQYSLNQKQTKPGTLQIEFSQSQFQKYKEYYSYLNGEQTNYETIQKHLEQFAEFTYKGQQCLGFSIEMIQQLCLSLPQYFEAQEFGKALSLIKSYFSTSKDFVLRSTKQIMDILLITLVKFKNSRQQLFELRNNLNDSFQNFSNEFFLLEKRKEELFTINLSKWGLSADQTTSMDITKCYTELKYAKEIMLPKETFQVNEKKDQYVYMLNHFNEQFDQQFVNETDKLLSEIEIYLENMHSYTNNQLHNWDFLIQEYSEYKFQNKEQLTVK